jgi:hypothetical protein
VALKKTQVLSSMLDWEQYKTQKIFVYNTSYHRRIKTSPLEVAFGIEPRTSKNPKPDLRKQYGEDLSTDIFKG